MAACAIHLLAEDGLIHLNDKVCKYWPEFSQNGKDAITIAHVLNHQAGLADAVMEHIAEDPYLAGDDAKILEILASAAPEASPGAETRYHYLTFGWLVDGIVRKVTRKTLKEFITEKVAMPLGIEQELLMGIGKNGASDPTISSRLSTLVLATLPPSTSEGSRSTERSTQKEDLSEKSTISSRRRPTGPSIFMNPTFFNDPRIREAAIPAANGHFSARALAKFYHAIATDAFPGDAESGDRSNAPVFSRKGWARSLLETGENGYATIADEAMLQGGNGSFSYGYYIFPLQSKSAERFLCFGHPGLGGSIAFCRVDGDDTLAIAVTINRLSLNNNKITLSIVRSIFEQLQIPFIESAGALQQIAEVSQ